MDDVCRRALVLIYHQLHTHNPVLIHAEGGGRARALWEWMKMDRECAKQSRTSR